MLFDEADPLTEAGRVALKPEAIEARQDGQARTLLKAGTFAFAILGGAHDLQDNITKQSDGCEYVVVTTREYRRHAAKHSSDVHEAAPEPHRNQECKPKGSRP